MTETRCGLAMGTSLYHSLSLPLMRLLLAGCVLGHVHVRVRVCVVIIYLLTELMNIVVHNASFLSCDLGVALHNMLHVTHALHRLSRLIPCTDQGIAEERSTRALRSVVLWDCALVKEGEERANGGPGSCDWGCF